MNRPATSYTIICFIMFLCLGPPLRGSQTLQTSATIGLNDAIFIALESNNRYKIAREKIEESKLKVRETWGRLWPDISTDIKATWFGAEKGVLDQTAGEYDLSFLKCSISLNPGVLYNSLMAARDGRVIAVNDERRIKLETTIATIRLYYKILLTAEIIKLRTDSLQALEENLRVVTAGYGTGTFTRLDYLRSKVAAANEKTRLINARNDYQSAMAALNIHMGRDIDAPLELDRATITGGESDEEKILKWTDDDRKQILAGMIADAFKNRPELVQIRAKKTMLVHNAQATEALYLWPTLYATGAYGMSKVIDKDPKPVIPDDPTIKYLVNMLEPEGWNKNWNVTLGTTYHWSGLVPFDQNHAKADELKSQARQVDLEMDDFVRSVRLDIQQGLLKLVSASAAIVSQKENIQSAEESVRVAIVQFKNGMIDNSKFLESNVELSNAKSMYIQALYDLQSAKAELNRSIGYDYFRF